MPILTIAIPTFNRAPYLKEQLVRLLALNDLDIEVLVSDNASTDGTKNLLLGLDSQSPKLVKVFNETNEGFDKNIASCFRNANGKFIWFLSDDDLVTGSLVHEIVKALDKHPDLGVVGLILNDEHNQVFKTRMVSYANAGPKLKIPKNTQIPMKDDLILRTSIGTIVSQISTCIISNSNKIDLSLNGGGIMHVVLTQQILIEKPSFMLLDSKAVNLGKKESISTWFLDSCLNGVGFAYKNLNLICGAQNCTFVIETTKILGLKIAFWSLGSEENHFNRKLLKHFDPPQDLFLFLKYFFWYASVRAALKSKILVRLLNRLRFVYLVGSQKLTITIRFLRTKHFS